MRPSVSVWLKCGICATVAASIAACASASPGREGNLGRGVFEYTCLTDQDPACPAGSTTMQNCGGFASNTPSSTQCFPSAVAVGGRFRVQFTPNHNTTLVGNPVLKAVAPDYMASLGDGSFKAIKAGSVGVYSQGTVDSTLVDYTIVRISPIAKLSIQDPTTKTRVPPGVAIHVNGVAAYKLSALDSNELPLAGAIESFLWETSDPKVVALQDDPRTATMHVKGVGAGTATLSAYADDSKTVQASFTITVQ